MRQLSENVRIRLLSSESVKNFHGTSSSARREIFLVVKNRDFVPEKPLKMVSKHKDHGRDRNRDGESSHSHGVSRDRDRDRRR